MDRREILAATLFWAILCTGCSFHHGRMTSGEQDSCAAVFQTIRVAKGMNRQDVEIQVANVLNTRNTYDPYGSNLLGGTVDYQHGNCVLTVTYKAGAPAPNVVASDGHLQGYPPIDETVLDYRIERKP